MSILSRYIMSQFFRLVAICQAGAITLFLMVEFIERIDDLIEKKAAVSDGLLFFAYKIPQLIVLSVPITVLLASVFTLVLLSRGNEIIAMRASGTSIYRTIAPILAASFAIALLTFAANETIVPAANRRVNHIWNVRVKKISPRGYNRTNRIWYRSEDNTIWQITFFDPFRDQMKGVTLYRLSGDNRLFQRIDAREVRWEPRAKRWLFRGGLIHHFKKNGDIVQEAFSARTFPLKDVPGDFKQSGKKPGEMNWVELRDYIRLIRSNGVDTTRYVVDLWAKLSTPFICFVLALVGVPFSVQSGRSGGLALGVAITIAISMGYLVLFYLGISLGHAGRLPPAVAAWGANLIFLAGGGYLLTHGRS